MLAIGCSTRNRWKLGCLTLAYLTWMVLQHVVTGEITEHLKATQSPTRFVMLSMVWFTYSLVGAALTIGGWSALLPQSLSFRCFWGLGCFVAVWLVWAASRPLLKLGWTRDDPANFQVTAEALENLIVAFVLLSIFRGCFGLKLSPTSEPSTVRGDVAERRPNQFTLSQALGWFVAFALFLGIARELAPRDYSNWRALISIQPPHVWHAALTCLHVIPAALAIAKSPRWAVGGVAYFLLMLPLTVAAIRWPYMGPPHYDQATLDLTLWDATFECEYMLHAAIWMLGSRWMGYAPTLRWHWPGRQRAVSPTLAG